jgi:8-oxo-dGTP pyrophosphatase MutT (NUDIX family)
MKAEAPAEWRFAPATVFAHVQARLALTDVGRDPQGAPGSDPARLRPVAVLIGLAAYPDEVRVILAQRTSALRLHSGQIAAAALREAQEEIGLDPCHVEPLGYLDPYPTGTGICIVPVVAKVATPITFEINPEEVDEAFEVPFAFLMDTANHALHHKEFEGKSTVSMRCPMAAGIFGA